MFNLDKDEFQQELEPPEEEQEEEIEEEQGATNALPRLLSGPGGDAVPASLDKDTAELFGTGDHALLIHFIAPNEENKLICQICGRRDASYTSIFRPVRLGAPFLLGVAIPALLEHMKPMSKHPGEFPFGGRRLITFSDSRQGTARFAVKAQQDAERNYIRSLLYHTVASKVTGVDPDAISKLGAEIKELEIAVKKNKLPVLMGMLAQKRDELQRLGSPGIGRLTWAEAITDLQRNPGLTHWMTHQWGEVTLSQVSGAELARLCLYREFFRRPRRQNSLETLGLLALDYPRLQNITSSPAVWQQRQLALQDWKDFLKIALDYYVRGSGALDIPPQLLRWLGIPVRQGYIRGPDAHKTKRNQHIWPQTTTGSRSRLVRLLSVALKLDLEKKTDCNILDEILYQAWQAVLSLLKTSEDGRLLNPDDLELVQVTKAWLCPVTRRVLPTAFMEHTPYIPNKPHPDLIRCQPIEMPRLPHPFWRSPTDANISREEVERWLEEDPQVCEVRRLGIWPEVSDRIASFAPYFRVSEHSAQLDGKRLQDIEERFKKGKLNVLSCSTTMEMGVDIGGLSAVAMNNAPPGPANFLQRAGRAGRRSETTATSLTMCKSSPHGEMVFRNPLWPFETSIYVPRVSLDSERIVNRHVNALTLAGFLGEFSPEDIPRLTTGWFFDSDTADGKSPPYQRFLLWCEEQATRPEPRLTAGIRRLIQRTCLEGNSVGRLLRNTAAHLEELHSHWSEEVETLRSELTNVATNSGDSPAEMAINRQLARILGEYLLAELTTRGFLPGYGFPVQVVPFVTTTWEELEQQRRKRQSGDARQEREDNRARRQGYPSRELAIAIRDYAPGTDTVVDGRVYRSSGVTLNWHIPPGDNQVSELQAFRWVWRCNECGANGTRPNLLNHCPNCSAHGFTQYEYLQPTGFSVDLYYRAHNDITTPQYIPVWDPLISLEGAPWLWLSTPALGRYRYTHRGHIFQRSDGLHGNGYSICLRCGRADSELADDGDQIPPLPESLKEHSRLRGGKEADSNRCPGNDEAWTIKRQLRLGVVNWTDVLELQLRYPDSGKPLDETTAYSLAVALRQALAEKLGINERELGCAAVAAKDADDRRSCSIVLYDTASGGAGYVVAAVTQLPSLLRRAKEILECRTRGCDSACHGCLLTYDTQHHLDRLNRHEALALLSQHFLNGLSLPEKMQVFGPSTQLEMEPMPLALRRELQGGGNELRLYVGDDPLRWEPLAWRIKADLLKWAAAGLKLTLVAPAVGIRNLPPEIGNDLAALLEVGGLELRLTDKLATTPAGTPLLAEIGAIDHAYQWSATQDEALAPNPNWGTGTGTIQYLRRRLSQGLPPLPNYPLCNPADLRKTPAAMIELRVGTELNGPARSFGQHFWELVLGKHAQAKRRMHDAIPLREVRYTDRYVKSPLTLVLFHEILLGLETYPGGLKPETHVTLETTGIELRDSKEPRWVFQDWRYESDRAEVFTGLCSASGIRATLREAQAYEVPHARELHLTWQDGTSWIVRLDQGLGYWRVSPRFRIPFPFDRSSSQQQEWLQQAEFDLQASDPRYPTYIYLGKVSD